MTAETAKRFGQRLRKFLKRGAFGICIAGLILYGLCVLVLLLVRFADPPFSMVQAQRRAESWFSEIEYRKQQVPVPLEQVSLHLQHAVIVAEDGGFYEHSGIDWKELRKAMEANQKRGRYWRGGSTISQQLVKNLFLTTHSSVFRKAGETALVFPAELILSKERILELYLNVIEWGPGIYGAEAASRHYYGVPASRLNREQAARLAACIPAPRTRRPARMDQYSADILSRMSSRGW